jgi:hypothetical protein
MQLAATRNYVGNRTHGRWWQVLTPRVAPDVHAMAAMIAGDFVHGGGCHLPSVASISGLLQGADATPI